MLFTGSETFKIPTFEDGVYISERLSFGPTDAVINIQLLDSSGTLLEMPLSNGHITIEGSESLTNFGSINNGLINLTFDKYNRPFYTLADIRFLKVTLVNVNPSDADSLDIVISRA